MPPRRRLRRRTLDAVDGIVTLAHESWHLRGVVNEARTQCYAIQTDGDVALKLGVTPADAGVIALRVAADDAVAPPGEYHSAECRPGGKYDLRPRTPDWPEPLAARPRCTNMQGARRPGAATAPAG